MKNGRKKNTKHASQPTIFSALRQVISGFTTAHAASPGSRKKITLKFAPICGAANGARIP